MGMNRTKRSGDLVIFDTTLRDGEQCPGASLNKREKLEIAYGLARLGVDVIEAGFPIASPDDFAAVNEIARKVKGPIIAGLARCIKTDIDSCAAAIAPAKRRRIHVFLATSKIHRDFKLKKRQGEILKQAVEHVKYARKQCDDVEFSPEDASRTEWSFLADVVRAVIDAGATTVNIPDTVGYTTPFEFGDLINYLFMTVPNIGKAVISVHCHNDLGLAVANSLAAVKAGAGQVECTINGLGERAGNASLEEVVMALHTRADLFVPTTNIRTKELCRMSRIVSRLTGITVQRNKAIVGANAFAHEAGIHQAGILKDRRTYEIMKPEDVGADGTELVLGKHSGRNALRSQLQKLGISLSDSELERVYTQFKQLADKKKLIYDNDLIAIAREQMDRLVDGVYELDYLNVSTGTQMIPTASIILKRNGETVRESACGDGPVDAVVNAINRMTGLNGKLLDCSILPVSVGGDAQGEASARVAFGKLVLNGKAVSTDIIEASAMAYLSCVNRYLVIRAHKR